MTRRLLPIRTVLEGKDWLGQLIGGKSFTVMRTLLIASMGEPLTPEELETFTAVTGRTEAPQAPCEELWIIAGRRSGKSLGVAVLAAYLSACVDYRGVLARGERGIVAVMAGSTQQAGQILNFLKGIFTQNPRFAAMVRKPNGARASGIVADRISLKNRIDIEVRPASFRTIRGITSVAIIAEEISTWQSDESLNPDFEILAAARPSLATTGGPMIAIGSPRAKRGETWRTFKKHFGPDGNPAIIVANGATKTFNPTIRQAVIDRAFEDDAQVAASEWGGKFRDDLESYVSPEVVDENTDFGCIVRPYGPGVQYFSHCDPSGGSQDSFCLSVGHIEDGLGILDALIEHRPPFSPSAVISDLCGVLHEYHLSATHGDKYASGFNSELFRKHGVEYYYSDRTTSDYFGGLLPILNSRRCRLLDDKRLASQLCGVERRPSRIGAKDAISHSPGSHEDPAAAVAGLMVRMIGIRDFAPKSFHPPFVAERPHGYTSPGLPPVIADPASYRDPLIASGPEYSGSGDFGHLIPNP
jgi:hypothetical protein